MNPSRPTRYFTPPEANALLGEVIEELETARELLTKAQALSEGKRAVPAAHVDTEEELDGLKERIAFHFQRVENRGVLVKGLSPMLVDFPALRNGHEVYLCWREGEEEVHWWHPIPTGIAGRKPLSKDDPGWWEWEN